MLPEGRTALLSTMLAMAPLCACSPQSNMDDSNPDNATDLSKSSLTEISRSVRDEFFEGAGDSDWLHWPETLEIPALPAAQHPTCQYVPEQQRGEALRILETVAVADISGDKFPQISEGVSKRRFNDRVLLARAFKARNGITTYFIHDNAIFVQLNALGGFNHITEWPCLVNTETPPSKLYTIATVTR